MKKTFKLSIVILCILMFFASCAGAPETKIPSGNAMDLIEGTTNSDGTVTVKGPSGVVVDKNGFLVGDVGADGSITVGDKVIEPAVPTSKESELIDAAFALCVEQPEFTGKIEEKKVEGYVYYAVLVQEGALNGVTYHAFVYRVTKNPETNDGDPEVFTSFTIAGKKHTVIVKEKAVVVDGKLICFQNR